MYNHTLIYQTEQQARKAERALMYTRIDCSNVHVSDQAQLSFQTTCKLEELARLKLRSELQATGSSFNVWEAPYEAGLRAIDGRQQQAPLFTEQARTVLRLAQEEAQRFHHNYIGTEHMLLGLMSEGEGVAARVLSSFGLEVERVRNETVSFLKTGQQRSPVLRGSAFFTRCAETRGSPAGEGEPGFRKSSTRATGLSAAARHFTSSGVVPVG